MTTPERGLFERITSAIHCDLLIKKELEQIKAICADFEQRLAEAETKIIDYSQTMIAAAEEINEHWQAHCDAEGYGPQNLVLRLERGRIQAQYDGYSIGMFREKMDEIAQLRARCGELEAIAHKASAVNAHWNEFGHEHGFDERMDHLHAALTATPQTAQCAHNWVNARSDGQGNELCGRCLSERPTQPAQEQKP